MLWIIIIIVLLIYAVCKIIEAGHKTDKVEKIMDDIEDEELFDF